MIVQWLSLIHICTFDAWAAIFAKKTIDYEFSVTNEVVQKERFRYFIKVPEQMCIRDRLKRMQTWKRNKKNGNSE